MTGPFDFSRRRWWAFGIILAVINAVTFFGVTVGIFVPLLGGVFFLVGLMLWYIPAESRGPLAVFTEESSVPVILEDLGPPKFLLRSAGGYKQKSKSTPRHERFSSDSRHSSAHVRFRADFVCFSPSFGRSE